MRASEPPYPSVSLALARSNALDDARIIGTTETCSDKENHTNQKSQKDREDPLIRTVYYTYQESLTYSYQVVKHRSNASTTSSTPDPSPKRMDTLFVRFCCVIRQILGTHWNCL